MERGHNIQGELHNPEAYLHHLAQSLSQIPTSPKTNLTYIIKSEAFHIEKCLLRSLIMWPRETEKWPNLNHENLDPIMTPEMRL